MQRLFQKIFLTAVFALSVSLPAGAMSLKQAIEKAVLEYPEVAIAAKNYNAESYRLDEAWGAVLPTVDLDADYRRQMLDQPEVKLPEDNRVWRNGHQATVIGRFVLFDGLQRANAIYRSEARLEASSLLVIESAEAVALQVVEAYIDHRRNTHLLRIADESVATHRRLLAQAKERVEGGRATQSAVQQVAERLYGQETVRAEVLQSLAEANAKFKALVGVSPTNTSPVGFPSDLPENADVALDFAINNNPTISALGLEAQARDYETDRIRGELAPIVSLEGRAQYGDDINGDPGRNDDFSVQLRLSWQLFDGGQKLARTREAAELAGAAYLERDLSIRRVQQRIDAAYGKIAALNQRISASERQTAEARKLVESYGAEYDAGRISLVDFLDAERTVAASRFETASISGVRLFTGYTVKALTGTLLDYFDIEANFTDLQRPSTIGLPGVRSSQFKIEPLQ